VNYVYINNGNDVSGAGPGVQIWTTDGGDGLYGAWKSTVTPEPVSMLLMGTFLSLAGGLLSKKKRAL
jgi:hypothetical protein